MPAAFQTEVIVPECQYAQGARQVLLVEQGTQADFVTRIRVKHAGIDQRQFRYRAQLVECGEQRGVSGLFIGAEVAYQVAARQRLP